MGALTKEYFSNGHEAVLNDRYLGRYQLFEGEEGHKVPSHDAMLLRSGVFEALGKFMAHSYIHTGVALHGVCSTIAQYLCSGNFDANTVVTVTNADIPSYEVRDLMEKVIKNSYIISILVTLLVLSSYTLTIVRCME
jgi:hypothetical protein